MVCRLGPGEGVCRQGGRPGRALRDRDSPAQRDRRPHNGTCAQCLHPGRPDPPRAPRGQERALGPWDRSRGHRNPDGGGAPAAQGQEDPARLWPREVPGEGLAVAGREGRHHPRAASGSGRLLRLGSDAVHDGPSLLQGGPLHLRHPLRARQHLPGQAHGELVPRVVDGPLRRGGHHEAGDGNPVQGLLRGRGAARPHDPGRHHPSRDDSRRRGDSGASGGSALPGPGGQDRLASPEPRPDPCYRGRCG